MNPSPDPTMADVGLPASAEPNRSGRILFADDDEAFRTGLARRLQRAGFECDAVVSGAEAIRRLGEVAYDVLLSDINMPGNQGLELIQELPAVAPTLPVVLLTGRPTVETAARSVSLKVAAYLVKPPDFDELCRVLDRAAGEHRQMRILGEQRARLQDWDREIARLQQLLEQSSGDPQGTMRSYLRLTLRNLVVGLVEFENLLVSPAAPAEAARAIEQQEWLAALRKTVAVLGKTRDQFKSRELGELRKELEALLR